MSRILFSLLLMVSLAGCDDDGESVGWEGTLVGGARRDDRDCEAECLRGDHYPDGTCSFHCDSDEDCPGGTSCIDDDGGVCLLACELPEDCPDRYNCEGRENRGHGGDSLVCR